MNAMKELIKITLLVLGIFVISLSVVYYVQTNYTEKTATTNEMRELIEKYETQKYLLKNIRPRLKANSIDSLILQNLIDGDEEKAMGNFIIHVERHRLK